MTFKLSPVGNGQLFTNLGTMGVGYKVFAYSEGSFSTLQPTYTTRAGDVQNASPLVADASGRVLPMFLDSTLVYNIVITLPDGTTTAQYWDGVSVA